ncbi:MAG: 4Fe-4S dicluster domain-containing protein, partial [Anaerolineae bacterium]
VACKQWNDREGLKSPAVNSGSYENPADLSSDTWLRMRYVELDAPEDVQWVFMPHACMQCHEAACVEVCPTKALTHHPDYDFVMVDRQKCNGCGYCSQFCPFGIPRLDGSVISGAAKSYKCTFCQDRVLNGLRPACVQTCPTGALAFGPREQLVSQARERVETLKAQGFAKANLYGEGILGGLGRLWVLTASPAELGLPTDPKSPATAFAWQELVQPGLLASFGLSSLTAGIAWVIARRRIRMEEVE